MLQKQFNQLMQQKRLQHQQRHVAHISSSHWGSMKLHSNSVC